MLHQALAMRNRIQAYAWGSRTAIAELLGRFGPASGPQAELWMGAHPKAPSEVRLADGWHPLDEIVARFPEEILGAEGAARFGPCLPYLFKVLAAARPLSIQAHPSRVQALAGFARENRAGIPPDAPARNYRDGNHKPELICALSEFWAMSGFRPLGQICAHLEKLCPDTLCELVGRAAGLDDREGIRTIFGRLMGLGAERRRAVLDEALIRARQNKGEGDVCRWVVQLSRQYPGDVGVLAPALLNLVRLVPGEALFLSSGQLHAYLEGTGIELMANSDNVLRGGLTPKHVDVPELLAVLVFDGRPASVLRAENRGGGAVCYRTPAEEFELWGLEVDSGQAWSASGRRGVEILLCTEGDGQLTVAGGSALGFRKGESLLVPAAAGAYRIEGRAVIYRAAVPDAVIGRRAFPIRNPESGIRNPEFIHSLS